ncbi:hypothetical protein GJAV_G00189510 [Gymnothorax javanicus]|nr:hypothetical protein GJAV_G00189510 [Gymnothorax javanicus]
MYYEMRTRRNSMANSSSPSRSLPRSISNVEGRSVPATPLLSRTGPTSTHVRSDVSGGGTGRPWADGPEVTQVLPLQSQEGSSSGSFERGGCPYSSQARRSNSSEALLDRSTFPEEGGPRTGMPSRSGPYKSSEALTDGRLRQVHRVSPERHLNGHVEHGRMRSSVGGRGGGGGGYNEILMDYIWGKQQKMQAQQQQQQQRHQAGVGGNPRPWPDPSCPPPGSMASPHFNGFPPSHFAAGPPPYSPLLLRGKPGEPRRVKVTRTKSCGPFIPLQQHQQDAVLLSAYAEPPHPTSSSASSSTAALYPYPPEPLGPAPRRAPHSRHHPRGLHTQPAQGSGPRGPQRLVPEEHSGADRRCPWQTLGPRPVPPTHTSLPARPPPSPPPAPVLPGRAHLRPAAPVRHLPRASAARQVNGAVTVPGSIPNTDAGPNIE